MLQKCIAMLVVMALALAAAQAQDEGEQTGDVPKLIKVSDRDAIEAAMDSDVIVEGTVESADWSRSGKVMNIDFKDAAEPKLLVVVFERNRQRFDEAFGGDMSKAIAGKTIRVKGKLQPYGGHVEEFKDRPQIIMDQTSQLTIVEDESQEPAGAATSE